MHHLRHLRSSVVALMTCLLIVLSSGCSSDFGISMRLAGREEGEDTLSSCELSLKSANSNDAESVDGLQFMFRKIAAQRAQQRWLGVAEYCSGRFAEGTMSSALAGYRHYLLANQQDDSASPHSSLAEDGLNESELSDLGFDPSSISSAESSAIALAEDRSGFALEILAARNGNDAGLLALSDNQKAVAQTFVSVHPNASDPRQKVYSVTNLLSHPQTIADPANGLTAPTAASVLMNCARAEIAAMTAARNASARPSSERLTRLVAELATLRAYQALKLGYPAFESALFVSKNAANSDN